MMSGMKEMLLLCVNNLDFQKKVYIYCVILMRLISDKVQVLKQFFCQSNLVVVLIGKVMASSSVHTQIYMQTQCTFNTQCNFTCCLLFAILIPDLFKMGKSSFHEFSKVRSVNMALLQCCSFDHYRTKL